ncbi:amidohydrolase family protein [Winogradskyella sp.]|uniref:amidohydrolase family protein n=1 Tax=Winogradskyella sp. TaxID=1883156 RepID=UPI00262E5FF2|nr:amidohydrolase family protein [Winogradskyella sp.]
MHRLKIVLVLITSICIGNAQNSFIIENVKLFDGESIIESVSVKVEDGIIKEVSKTIQPTDKDEVIDGKGKTLIPALSNAHVHAWAPNSLTEAAKAGVLNVMDMHGLENYQIMLKQLKDSTNFARYYVSGYAATAPEGHGTQYGFPVPTLTKPEDAKKFVEDRVKANVNYIKIIVEPWRKTLSIEIVSELIKEAHKARKIAVVHVSRLEDAIDVLSKDADGLVHIWRDQEMDKSQLKQLSEEKDFFVIPTVLTILKAIESLGEDAETYLTKKQLLAEIKKLHDIGIPILAGTDPPNLGINYGTDLYEELKLLGESGLSNIEVLKAGTSNITKAFGLENTGYIKTGFIADLILVDGDVTENINTLNNSKIIWKNGKKVKL